MIHVLRSVARLLLPYSIRRPLADRVYGMITRIQYCNAVLISYGLPIVASAYAWRSISGYRYLLGCNLRDLGLRQRLQRRALTAFLALPDRYCRRRYRCFGQALKKINNDKGSLAGTGVALMIGTLGPGGSERQAVLTLKGFAKRGYGPLRLICSFLRNEPQRFFLSRLESAGIPVCELNRDSSCDGELGLPSLLGTVHTLPSSLCEVADFIRTLASRPPKVVHLWLDDVNIKGGLAAVALRIPRIVLGMRSLPPCNFPLHQPYMREGYRWLARQPGVVLLNNSSAGARAYEEWLGLSEGSIRVVRNGFDFDRTNLDRYLVGRGSYRTHHKIPITAPVLGTVMRLSEEKRPLLWLEIAAAIRRRLPDARFLIVGDGLLRGDMEARAACNDLREAVHFTGHIQDTFTAIAATDIFLLISRVEGLPNVLVEAQALGIPVVTTNVGGASETVRHGLSGWILERDNAEYVADVVVQLLRDQPWRSKVRVEAPRFVRESFGMERMLDETLAAYRINVNDFMISEAAGITQ